MTAAATDLTALRDSILLATLPNVAFDGWTRKALQHGADLAGPGRAGLLRAFPDGIPELVDHFADWADRQTLARIDGLGDGWQAMKIRDRVAFALRARLEALEPYKEAVRRLAGLAVGPAGALRFARSGWRTVDRIWRAAGDRATDFNHYSKRGLLAGVQAATLLAWLGDRSDGHAETWAFLDRRIATVLRVGRSLGGLQRLGPAFEAPWRLAGRLRARGGRPAPVAR